MTQHYSFDVLKLSELDPEKDIIIVNVEIGKMPTTRIRDHLMKVKANIQPMLDERGFSALYNPIRTDSDGKRLKTSVEMTPAKKDEAEERKQYENAMKIVRGR